MFEIETKFQAFLAVLAGMRYIFSPATLTGQGMITLHPFRNRHSILSIPRISDTQNFKATKTGETFLARLLGVFVDYSHKLNTAN
ncbi:MAG: hypothetical protein ACKO24_05125 [Leptolyngbyaceae cyanobacterium]